MTANKAIEILDDLYNKNLGQEKFLKICAEAEFIENNVEEEIDEINNINIALLTAIDALKERGETK